MVNGNYIFNGDRPSSESETVDDHVHTRTVERKNKRKSNRTANELQKSLNQAHLDNETDSIKYEKKVKEPKLLRYVSSKEVEQNFVSDKLDETFDFKPTAEIARRHAFTKKPKNPADGSPNYVYSRSSSNCSSPTGNLPTISEHAENYGTYRVCAPPSPTVSEIINGYENKFDKYFAKPREVKKLAVKGSHPDSLYRVTTGSGAGATKIMRTLRVLRWPFALLTVCVALAVFVYFLMPENMEPGFKSDLMNGTYWETGFAETQTPLPEKYKHPVTTNPTIGKKGTHATLKPGLKTSEIDFYEEDINKKEEFTTQADTITENTPKRKLPLEPVFPTHITPEVQYGDSQKIRTPKLLDKTNTVADDSTLKPHITQKPERPLEIYFKESDALNTMSTENIPRAENSNDFTNYGEKQSKKTVQPVPVPYPIPYKELSSLLVRPRAKDNLNSRQYAAPDLPPELQEVYSLPSAVNSDVNFTSGHSKLFGISIEDAEKFKSTTQNSIYNTRVSPTLPTWRDGDDTTKKYPVNITSDVHQCRSTRLPVCRGILPYDLAGAAETIAGVDVSTYLPQIEYLIATNCSDRLKHFMCALLEPECNGPPYKPKLPCHNLCKAITDGCEGHIPRELMPMLKCNQYTTNNCVAAKTPCFQRELQCGDGSCVPRDWMCDGTRDCPAGEDEAQCAQCDSNEFTCPSGGCVLNRWLCDGYSDCDKGEDEDPERCGSGHYVAAATSDLGEESAGSAPAPSVRRPNRVQSNKSHRNTGENDSSKELLVTSDSTNAFKRNFTRRPSLSRLTPYTRPALREKHNEQKAKVETKTVHTTISPKDETPEQELMRDLGILEVLEKESKMYKEKIPKSQQQKPFLGRAPTPSFSEKSVNKMEKVIDGAAMLQKAVNSDIETPATKEEDSDERNGTDDDDESYEAPIPSPNPKSLLSKAIGHNDPTQGKGVTGGSYTAHASPCPAGELRCVDGRCITLAQLCDGTIDCTDHADEDNCYT